MKITEMSRVSSGVDATFGLCPLGWLPQGGLAKATVKSLL